MGEDNGQRSSWDSGVEQIDDTNSGNSRSTPLVGDNEVSHTLSPMIWEMQRDTHLGLDTIAVIDRIELSPGLNT
jgi:hypothetical protein